MANSLPPSPKPMPLTPTAGRNSVAQNGENRPMAAPDQKLGQMSVNPGRSGDK